MPVSGLFGILGDFAENEIEGDAGHKQAAANHPSRRFAPHIDPPENTQVIADEAQHGRDDGRQGHECPEGGDFGRKLFHVLENSEAARLFHKFCARGRDRAVYASG